MKVTIYLFALFAAVLGYPNRNGIDEAYKLLESFAYVNSKGDGAGNSVSLLRKKMGTLERGMLGNSPLTQNKTGCSCVGYDCGCCVDLKLKEIHLDDTVCVNFTYLPAPEYGISLTLSFDGKVFINETISARNPPPLCVEIPYLKDVFSLCLKFKDLEISNKSLSGCLDLQLRVIKLKVEDISLGCFKIPPGGVTSLTTFKVAESSLERGHLAGQGQKFKVNTNKLGQNVKDSSLYWRSMNKN